MGGNAPFIVFDSADIDLAVTGCMAAKFRNAGQTCVSTNRLFVQSGVYDEFMAKLEKAMEEQISIGDGVTAGVTQGPLINKRQMARVEELVDEALTKGAKCTYG